MNKWDLSLSINNLCALSGLNKAEQGYALILTALAKADACFPLGISRDDWPKSCASVYDAVRNALAAQDSQ